MILTLDWCSLHFKAEQKNYSHETHWHSRKDHETEEKTVEFPLTWRKTWSSQLKENHLCITRALVGCHKSEREGMMGWCRAREEEQCRRMDAHLGKWWLLGRWSPAAGTGGESAFLSAGSPPAAGDWKPQVGSLPPVCAISPFGCWTTPDGERKDHVWLTLSYCPISPGLLMETHPELQHWPKTGSSHCLTQTLWVFVSVPQFPFSQMTILLPPCLLGEDTCI